MVLGCLDPDLHKLDRSAPTPTKLSEMLVIQTAVSGMNQAVQLDKRTWHLWSGDVSTAFLQGVRLAGTFPAELYEVLGNLYGFASAPRTWAKHVVSTLLRADFTQHRLDRMCFYKKDSPRGRLLGGLPVRLQQEGAGEHVHLGNPRRVDAGQAHRVSREGDQPHQGGQHILREQLHPRAHHGPDPQGQADD